jgi:hypothetical protein
MLYRVAQEAACTAATAKISEKKKLKRPIASPPSADNNTIFYNVLPILPTRGIPVKVFSPIDLAGESAADVQSSRRSA